MSGTIVDDSDQAVVYSGTWHALTGYSSAYQGTLHESGTLNSQITFAFQGNGVMVNSGQPGTGWRVPSSYSIDGDTTVYSNDSYQSTTEAYRSPTLSNGQHTLIITVLSNRDSGLYLDYFLVFTPDDSNSSTSTSSSTTTVVPVTGLITSSALTSTGLKSSGTSTAGFNGTYRPPESSGSLAATMSVAPSTPNATQSKDPSPIPLIVGPIFGALGLCAIIFWLVKRRKNRKEPKVQVFESIYPSPSSEIHSQLSAIAAVNWNDGRKPSSLIHSLSQPPPYVQDPQPSSPSLTPIRQPAKFRTG